MPAKRSNYIIFNLELYQIFGPAQILDLQNWRVERCTKKDQLHETGWYRCSKTAPHFEASHTEVRPPRPGHWWSGARTLGTSELEGGKVTGHPEII